MIDWRLSSGVYRHTRLHHLSLIHAMAKLIRVMQELTVKLLANMACMFAGSQVWIMMLPSIDCDTFQSASRSRSERSDGKHLQNAQDARPGQGITSTHRLLEGVVLLEVGSEDVVQYIFSRFAGASVRCGLG